MKTLEWINSDCKYVKRIPLLLCTLVLVSSGVTGQGGIGPGWRPPNSWSSYTVKNEEFAVSLPALPAMITSKTFQTRLNKHRRERQLKTTAYGVTYSIDVFENAKPRQSLDEFITEQDANSEFDVATERAITINGVAGKEYSSRNKTTPATVQFFATEKRLYRFTASSAGANVQNDGVTHFFSSIVLGKKTDGIKVSDGPGIPFETSERIFTGREVGTKARLISKPEPSYSESARQKQVTGTVVLKVVFSSTGKVTNIRVVHGLPNGLTEKSIAAAKKIKFIPATKDGKPVSMWMQLEYNFNLY